MAIEDGEDLVTAINATRDGVYVKGEKIVLDGDTTVAGSFKVTDTIFAERMNISKFTTGTLNAANVNIINLNAQNIVGVNADLIRASFSAATGGETTITGDGVKTMAGLHGEYSILEEGGVRFYQRDHTLTGSIETGYEQTTGGRSVTAFINEGMEFTVTRNRVGRSNFTPFSIGVDNKIRARSEVEFDSGLEVWGGLYARGATHVGRVNIYSSAGGERYIVGNKRGGLNIHADGIIYTTTELVVLDGNLEVSGKIEGGLEIEGVLKIGGEMEIPEGRVTGTASGGHMMLTANKNMLVDADYNIEMFSRGTKAMLIGRDNVLMWRNINMQGYDITNQSDIRLKEDIRPTRVSGIRETKRLRMVDYKWKKDHPVTKGYTQEEQFGIIAQDSQFLQTRDGGSDSYLSVNMNKQINLNTLTNQELITKVERLEEQIKTIMEAV